MMTMIYKQSLYEDMHMFEILFNQSIYIPPIDQDFWDGII